MKKTTGRKNRPLKTFIFGLCTVSLLCLGSFAVLSQKSITLDDKTYIEENGKWFVVSGNRSFEVVPDVVTLKFRDDIKSMDKVAFYSEHNTEIIRENRLGFVDVKVPSGTNPVEYVMELRKTGMVASAQVNTFGTYSQNIPDDTDFALQWGMNNTGQTGGTPDADINAPEAWDIETGSPGVIVAVLDSGVDIDHEDLNCNIWVNPGEDLDMDGIVWDTDDLNGVDDDGNGLIDDICGWDFHHGNNDPRGPYHHGTHVAGIVGACGNNATGVIGVAGGFDPDPGTKMLAIGVGDNVPDSSILDDAILYVADMGARVITMSLSVDQSDAIDAALDDAYNVQGIFINCSTGNENHGVNYPGTDPNVMAVGATDHDDNRASPSTTGSWGSNFGPEVEVVAPGVNIHSTRIGDTYAAGDGTSYASPHVAGTAALMFAANPAATNVEVRQCIIDTADDEVGDPTEDTPGKDDYYGWGRLDTEGALLCITTANEPPVCDANGPYMAECQGQTTMVPLDGTGSYDPDGDPLTYSWATDCPGGYFDDHTSPTPVLTLDSVGPCPLECTVTLTVTDDSGESDSCSADVTITDTTAPVVTCPPDVTIECDESSDPSNTGMATATDACDGSPVVGFSDSIAPGSCPQSWTITRLWTATDACGNNGSCTQVITVVDTTAPVISCPPDVTVTCGDSLDPADTGMATATDNCDPAPVITYADVETWPTCAADPVMYTITRTWTATDACGNANSCDQTITVMKLVFDLDIKPGSCPNSFNAGSRGYLPVALLGTPDFDVTQVDLSTVVISRVDCIGGIVAPHEGPPGPHSVLEDVGTPFPGDPCDCHELGGDGIMDLSMKFNTLILVPALGLDTMGYGTFVELAVTGTLYDGCEFIAKDCIRLVPPGNPSFNTMESNSLTGGIQKTE